mmetsp:Transcript_39873/g.120409  ORF Transcript_39873/g.120409 Transcript_39873/m.120409 type:complete len:209 (-) Transcript_39873:1181-1807(-)
MSCVNKPGRHRASHIPASCPTSGPPHTSAAARGCWRPRTPRPGQCLAPNCVSVTPALMMPVEDVPPETMFPISSTISEPLHFWCVNVSTPASRSLRWISWTYAAAPRVLYSLAKRSMLKASQWKPASVMNCQQNPSFARSQMKLSICASVMPDESQLKEGLKLYASIWCGTAARTSVANFVAWLRIGLPVSIQMQSAYGAKAIARWMQ